MAEEQRCQEGHRLCVNNCGFLGSPATMDMCSKCYRDLRLKEERASSAKLAVEKSLVVSPSSSSSSSSSSSLSSSCFSLSSEDSESAVAAPVRVEPPVRSVASAAAAAGRCLVCRKRVGLVGFSCRCGVMCCGAHRYPEQHGCTFDFKAAGREAIARENPVVKADKLGGRRI